MSATQPRNELCEFAVVYAQRGWAVFPLKPRSKAPLTPHGFKDASNDAQTIRAWWARWPKANIGIACGASGLVVVDVDNKDARAGDRRHCGRRDADRGVARGLQRGRPPPRQVLGWQAR